MFSAYRKVKIDKAIYERLGRVAQAGGYSSTDELILHVLEKELERIDSPDEDEVANRLRGLGYIE